MLDIREILARKKLGIDCTEDESALVKRYLRELPVMFPLEWAEVEEETSSVH